jgi:hypothetical protein
MKRRADGSAWYERSIRNRKIAGSNPAQSIELPSEETLGSFYAQFYKIVDHQTIKFHPRNNKKVDYMVDHQCNQNLLMVNY